MILTPTNRSRVELNRHIRENLKGITSDIPIVGEKLYVGKIIGIE